RRERGFEPRPALELPFGPGLEHARHPIEDARGALPHERPRGRVGRALVELGEEAEVGERRPVAEQVPPAREVRFQDRETSPEGALDEILRLRRRADEAEAWHNALA